MAQSLKAFVDRDVLFAFCILGIVATTLITLLRIYVRVTRQRSLREDDFVLFAGVVIYITMASLYIVDLPYLYTLMDWLEHPSAPTQQITWSYTMMMRLNWAVTLFFWAALWCVKLSLLLFFRRVISQIRHWMRAWWFILGFTVITFLGCVISQITSCDSPKDFTVLRKCASARNQRAQVISLYYSYAADVLTDMLIMALPLRIVAALRLATRDKWILACLFGVTSIAIVVSTVRVFLIYAKTGTGTPSPPWLGIWAVIEGMVAIVVGCIPVISQIFRTSKEISSASSGRAVQPMKQYEGSDVHTGNTSAKTTVEYGRRSPERSRRISTTGHPLDEGLRRIRSRTEIFISTVSDDGACVEMGRDGR